MIPLLIIRVYRLIPPRTRSTLFTSTGASTRALADIAAGASPWRALWRHGGLVFRGGVACPSWTDPGPQGRVGAAWKLGDGGRGAP